MFSYINTFYNVVDHKNVSPGAKPVENHQIQSMGHLEFTLNQVFNTNYKLLFILINYFFPTGPVIIHQLYDARGNNNKRISQTAVFQNNRWRPGSCVTAH